MRFLRPNVPILSHIVSSFSPLTATGRGDFGRRVAISNADVFPFPPTTTSTASSALFSVFSLGLIRLKLKAETWHIDTY